MKHVLSVILAAGAAFAQAPAPSQPQVLPDGYVGC
jgi:hypothetical protein